MSALLAALLALAAPDGGGAQWRELSPTAAPACEAALSDFAPGVLCFAADGVHALAGDAWTLAHPAAAGWPTTLVSAAFSERPDEVMALASRDDGAVTTWTYQPSAGTWTGPGPAAPTKLGRRLVTDPATFHVLYFGCDDATTGALRVFARLDGGWTETPPSSSSSPAPGCRDGFAAATDESDGLKLRVRRRPHAGPGGVDLGRSGPPVVDVAERRRAARARRRRGRRQHGRGRGGPRRWPGRARPALVRDVVVGRPARLAKPQPAAGPGRARGRRLRSSTGAGTGCSSSAARARTARSPTRGRSGFRTRRRRRSGAGATLRRRPARSRWRPPRGSSPAVAALLVRRR